MSAPSVPATETGGLASLGGGMREVARRCAPRSPNSRDSSLRRKPQSTAIYSWLSTPELPDSLVIVIAREDDYALGVLHSRAHELWALRMGTWLGVANDPRYTPTSTFETFPFPWPLDTPDEALTARQRGQRDAIGAAARALDEARRRWLNPPEWVREEPDVLPSLPPRLLPVDERVERAAQAHAHEPIQRPPGLALPSPQRPRRGRLRRLRLAGGGSAGQAVGGGPAGAATGDQPRAGSDVAAVTSEIGGPCLAPPSAAGRAGRSRSLSTSAASGTSRPCGARLPPRP